MGNSYFHLGVATQPEATKTAAILTVPKSLVDFGFDAAMVERSSRAFIYVHNQGLIVKWAQDYPRVQPTQEADVSGYRMHVVEPPPTPAANDGHGIAAGQEREVIGRRQLQLLRMVSTGATSTVTITLES